MESVLKDPLVILAFIFGVGGSSALVFIGLCAGGVYLWEQYKKKSEQTRVAMETRTSTAASKSNVCNLRLYSHIVSITRHHTFLHTLTHSHTHTHTHTHTQEHREKETSLDKR